MGSSWTRDQTYVSFTDRQDSLPLSHQGSPLRVCVCCSVVSDSLQPHGVAWQAALSMGLTRQDYWSGLPRLSPGDLSDPGIEPTSPVAPALQVDSLLLSHWRSLGPVTT